MRDSQGTFGSGEWVIEPGTMVNEYRIIRPIGRGGMGEVYLARDMLLGRKAALKVMRPSASSLDVEQLVQESQTTAMFNHPHIVTVYGAGTFQGNPYLAMEFLEGDNLRPRMGRGQLSLMEALRLMLAVAEALTEAHRHGVLHRDLKPENILIPRDGRLRVVDFGLSEVIQQQEEADGTEPTLLDIKSGEHQLRGTPAYMSPELWRGHKATEASDIWALGILLRELVAGRHPFRWRTVLHLAQQVMEAEEIPPPEGAEGLSEGVVEIMERCLAKEPARRPGAAEVAEVLRQHIAGRRPAGRQGKQRNPFRGLRPFAERHADRFFGRDDEINAFMELMRDAPVLPVVGPSGAGKSSLVKAGVVPRLKEQAAWTVIQVRPGSRPFRALAARLSPVITLADEKAMVQMSTASMDVISGDSVDPALTSEDNLELQEAGHLARKLERSPRALSLVLERIAAQLEGQVLLVVDQLEELYIQVEDREVQTAFMEAICTGADDPQGPARIVFTLREDFLGRLPNEPWAQQALGNVTVVRAPGAEAQREMLTRPVEQVGYAFEDEELVQQIIEAAGQEQASLPLLQFTAHMLWKRKDEERKLLTREAYESFNGLAGALAQHADGVLEGLAPDDEEVVREIMLRLVTPEGDRRVLSSEELLEGLGSSSRKVLPVLVKARLVSVRRSYTEAGSHTVQEIVHESLARTWTRFARWIDQSREDLTFLRELEQAASLWERRGRPADEVWKGRGLADGLKVLGRGGTTMPRRVAAFLEAGRALEARRIWKRRAAVALVVVAAVAALVVQSVLRARSDAQRKETQKRWAEAQREGARAAVARGDLLEARAKTRGSLQTQDSSLGRMLWWRLSRNPLIWSKRLPALGYGLSLSPDGKVLAVACGDSTVRLVDAVTGQTRRVLEHEDQVVSVAFSHQGGLLATGTWSGAVTLYDLKQATERRLVGHTDKVQTVAFSPRGDALASAGADHTVRLWSLVPGGNSRTLRGHTLTVRKVAFSPDGRTMASGAMDGAVLLWNTSDGSNVGRLVAHKQGVTSLAYSPDGKTLATCGLDRAVRLWDVKTRAQVRTVREPSHTIYQLAFAPNGRLLATSDWVGSVQLWDPATGKKLRALPGHSKMVQDLVFSHTGRHLVTTGRDRRLRLWDVTSPGDKRVARGHGVEVFGTAFSPDDKVLASGGSLGTVRLWDVRTGQQLQVLQASRRRIRGLAYDATGRFLAAGGRDGSLRLFNLGHGGHSRTLGGHWSEVNSLTISLDGRLLASAGGDWKVRIWDMKTAVLKKTFKGHRGRVLDVAFSPDGALLASSGKDRTIRLWDLASWTPGRTFTGHSSKVNGVCFAAAGEVLFSTSSDQTIRRWDLASGTGKVLRRLDARAYRPSCHPSRPLIGVPLSDGTALLMDTDTGASKVLRGHRSEVNGIVFDHSGTRAATTSDDGTVRLWDVATGRPRWHAPALLPAPPRLYTHQGWIWLGAPGKKVSTSDPWRAARGGNMDQVAASADGSALCVSTWGQKLEMWAAGRRLFSEPVGGVDQLLAYNHGCVVRAGGKVTHYDRRMGARLVYSGATAVDADGALLLLATERKVLVFDPLSGKEKQSLAGGRGTSAMARVGAWIARGNRNGRVRFVGSRPGSGRRPATLEGTPSSPVTSMLEGPNGTLIAGFANGTVGIWQLDNGLRLDHSRLHGAVLHLLRSDRKLYAASELGDHLVLDLSVFYEDYCRLLRRVWQRIPVVWGDGAPLVSAPPADHHCKVAEKK